MLLPGQDRGEEASDEMPLPWKNPLVILLKLNSTTSDNIMNHDWYNWHTHDGFLILVMNSSCIRRSSWAYACTAGTHVKLRVSSYAFLPSYLYSRLVLSKRISLFRFDGIFEANSWFVNGSLKTSRKLGRK